MTYEKIQQIIDMGLDDYSRALIVATIQHAGVYDKGGKPYIEHPLGVARYCNGVLETVVALLHDTIEDTDLTLNDLGILGFNRYIVDAVEGVTKLKGEPYDQFIDRCVKNDISRAVKKADIKHNTEPERLHYLDVEVQNRLVTKYAKAENTINQFELFNQKR